MNLRNFATEQTNNLVKKRIFVRLKEKIHVMKK